MPPRKRPESDDKPLRRRPPATTPEARENQMVALATDLAEQQLADGSASAQVISFYLKLGSSREKLEQERLHHENNLLQAKQEMIESQARIESIMVDALNAFKSYSGADPQELPADYEQFDD